MKKPSLSRTTGPPDYPAISNRKAINWHAGKKRPRQLVTGQVEGGSAVLTPDAG